MLTGINVDFLSVKASQYLFLIIFLHAINLLDNVSFNDFKIKKMRGIGIIILGVTLLIELGLDDFLGDQRILYLSLI